MIKEKKKSVRIRQNMNSDSLIAGIDLGDSTSLATILTATGDIADRFCFQMNDQGYTLFTNKVPRDARLAFEATSTAYPFFRMLKGRGYNDVTVAHPTELAWIVRSKKKNDRADSLKIAKLHLAGLLPESHLLPQMEQIERDLLIQSQTRVGDRQNQEQNHKLPQEGRCLRPSSEKQG
jgi:transposase